MVAIVIIFVLMFLFRGSPSPAPAGGSGTFGAGDNRNVVVTPPGGSNEPIAGQTALGATTAKVFKINDGPVASAVLMQMGRPTTTVARFVMADSGHVFDLAIDSPGSLARAVSNTTIPGIKTASWTTATGKPGDAIGSGAILQYLNQGTIKTLQLAFPPATTTLGTAGAVHIQFFPDGAAQVATSPEGSRVAYLVQTTAGADIYTANPNGGGGVRLTSLPLSQVLLSWPSTGFILAQSPASAGVPGIVFSINAKTGAAEPVLYADGITAVADPVFSKVVYQTEESTSRATWVRDVKSGGNTPLSFDPLPEKCVWSTTATSTMYCAAPLTYVPANFLDLWHEGTAAAADSIFMFNVATGRSSIIASPGGQDGGQQADIASLALSADNHYLLFIRKGDRSLWAVRLSQ